MPRGAGSIVASSRWNGSASDIACSSCSARVMRFNAGLTGSHAGSQCRKPFLSSMLPDYLAGHAGALEAIRGAVRDALTTRRIFRPDRPRCASRHDRPHFCPGRTGFTNLPMKKKLALKMNEHNNVYMAMGRYAVWTSDVNDNDKPDLNEAFFRQARTGARRSIAAVRAALRGTEFVAGRARSAGLSRACPRICPGDG